MMSRRLDNCLDESMPLLDSFWSADFSEIEDLSATSTFTKHWQTLQLGISKTGCSSNVNERTAEAGHVGWQPEG